MNVSINCSIQSEDSLMALKSKYLEKNSQDIEAYIANTYEILPYDFEGISSYNLRLYSTNMLGNIKNADLNLLQIIQNSFSLNNLTIAFLLNPNDPNLSILAIDIVSHQS